MTFSEMEAQLARVHEVASDKRIAFHGRLKTLLRLGFPSDVKRGKGRIALFEPGDVVRMAVLCDLTRFGLTPERAVALLSTDDFAMFAAVSRSVEQVAAARLHVAGSDEFADPLLLYFNPNALAALAETERKIGLLWAPASHVAKHLAAATNTFSNRQISIMNVPALLHALTAFLSAENRERFLLDVAGWAADGMAVEPDRSAIPDWEKQ